MSHNLERWKRGPAALAGFGIVFAVACGVDEHPREEETKRDTRPVIAPPPPPGSAGMGTGGATAVSGGAGGNPVSAGGSAVSGGKSGFGGFGGFGTVGGSPGGGAPSAGGALGANGGALATGGTPSPTGGSPATGGSSGVLVNINGTMIPKEDVIGFVHIGHSNMAGRASSPSGSRPYHFDEMDLHAWMFKENRWDPALEPNTAGDAENTMFGRVLGGPGTALVKEAVALAPSKYFVSLGYGRASAYCSQFLPGGLYYDSMMESAIALKSQITFAAILIMLGITERHGTDSDINGYPNCINTLVTAIRNDLGQPNLPVLVTDYEMESTGMLSPTSSFATSIIPQIRNIPNVVSNSAIVPTEELAMQDDHHFNLDGHREWVRRALQIMRDKGWFPWAN